MKNKWDVFISKKTNKILLLLIGIGLTMTVGWSFASYVGNNIWNYYIESNGFYFNSDQLSISNNEDNSWNKDRVYFDLNNFLGEEVTENDIEYTATCNIVSSNVSGLSCSMNGNSNSSYSGELISRNICINETGNGVDTDLFDQTDCEDGGYTWGYAENTENLFFQVLGLPSSVDIYDIDVEVVVTSSVPYAKTMSSVFKLYSDDTAYEDLIIQHFSEVEYEKVVITNLSSITKNLALRFNADDIRVGEVEADRKLVDANGYVNDVQFHIEPNTEKVFYFYKTSDSIVIDESDFTIVDLDDVFPKVTNISLLSQYNSYEISSPTFTNDKISIEGFLASTNATLIYEITIKNDSPYDYIMHDVIESVSNTSLSFRFNDFTYGTTISAKSEVTFTMTVSSLYTNRSGTLDVTFLYKSPDEIPVVDKVLVGAKSTTGSYVKTGFFPSSDTRAVVEFTLVEPKSTSMWLFSSRRAYKNQMFGIAWNAPESLLQFNDVSYNLGATGYLVDVKYTADISKDGLLLNGQLYSNPSDTVWESIFELYMFANNEARTVRGHTNGTAVIHSVDIYENGVLVLEAIPVVLDSGETVYWNNVTNTPLTNVGTLTPVYH